MFATRIVQKPSSAPTVLPSRPSFGSQLNVSGQRGRACPRIMLIPYKIMLYDVRFFFKKILLFLV
jgi:hypothetical protein